MKKPLGNFRSMSLVLCGALLGLASAIFFVDRTASAAAPSVAPASPSPAASALRYEYKCITGVDGRMFKPDTLAALNREGAQAWRLLDGLGQVHMSGMDQFCFERAL